MNVQILDLGQRVPIHVVLEQKPNTEHVTMNVRRLEVGQNPVQEPTVVSIINMTHTQEPWPPEAFFYN